MVMKPLKLSLPLLLSALLSACAGTRPFVDRLTFPVSPAAAAAPAPAASGDAASLPKTELTPELLFGVLASEIAAQRGAAGSAALTDLALARQTRDPRLAERAAQFALLSGNAPVASDALSLWVELDPASTTANEQLMQLSLRAGKLDEGLRLFDAVLAAKPDQAPSLFTQLARLVPLQTDKTATRKAVEDRTARFPNLPEARFALIVAAAEAGDQATVDRQFDRLARLAPKWDLPVAWQADRLRKTDAGAAADFLKKELARRPDASLDLKMAYPRLLVVDKRFAEARQAFEALLAHNPRQPELLYASGLLAFQLNDLDAAYDRLQAALAAGYPDGDFLRFSLGQIAETRHDNAAARNWYRQVGPGAQYQQAQARLAFLDAQDGDPEAAIARLGKLQVKPEERMSLVLAQAEIAREAKRLDLAGRLLTQGLQRYPRAPELLYERALVSDLRHDTAAAERDLRLLLKLRPNDEQALNALGYILTVRTSRYQEAQALIDRALRRAPDNPMILDSKGWVLFKLGHAEDALRYLARAYSLLPDQEVAAHYGEVLWQLGRQDEARALWDKARQASPDHPELDETVKRLTGQ